MFQTIANVFRVTELRNKLLFTLAMLCVYRIGFYVPIPGVDSALLNAAVSSNQNSALGQISNYLSLFSGGNLGQSSIFGLGIMPYISASIIFQLLTTVLPSLEKLQKEGEPGRRKITEWTRYATVGLCLVQAAFWMGTLTKADLKNGQPHGFLYASTFDNHLLLFWVMGLSILCAGSIFLMWLGEQIDEFGIGNGVSLIIMAGILSRMPQAIIDVASKTTLKINTDPDAIGIGKLTFLIASFVFVVAGAIVITEAQRRIPIQQAKHMRGRHVYGGNKTYMPLRVNHGGVMPIIFAQSLMMFPTLLFTWLVGIWSPFHFVRDELTRGTFVYVVIYVAMIFFFSYFWNTVQFQPKELANQLRDYGSFVPGLRPGKRTAEYLENVMNRITYVGAAFLSIIAIAPQVVSTEMNIPFNITQFLGGTGLLIVIAVILDFVTRVEANLVMRDMGGFMQVTSSTKRRTRPDNRSGPASPRPKGLPT